MVRKFLAMFLESVLMVQREQIRPSEEAVGEVVTMELQITQEEEVAAVPASFPAWWDVMPLPVMEI